MNIETGNSFERQPASSGPAACAVLAQEEPRIDEHFKTEHLLPNLKRRTISGGAVTISSQAAKFLLNLASTVILARLLTPRDFGLVAMVTAVTGFVAMFRHAGLATPTVQRERDHTRPGIQSVLDKPWAVSGLCALILAALAPAHGLVLP